jgi:signal transduction histidine kinase
MHVVAEDEKVNVLLVDDQPARLLSYESILGGLGQNLIRAYSGIEALEQLLRGDFAVILLDVSMPGMDGFETASMIHEHPRYENTPIIFVTGVHVSELDRLKGYKLGAVDYVSIPIIPEILRSKVEVLAELHLQRRKLKQLNDSLARANEALQRTNVALNAEKTAELERLNRSLKEADRQKDEFLAILAHELRNPLAPIRHAVDSMKREELPPDRLKLARDVMDRQLVHLTHLVDDLLDISRITHGTINLSKERLSAKAVLDRALETLRPVVDEHRHDLSVHCPDTTLEIYGDGTRLVQVLGNLLNNAAKYTDRGGRIELSVVRDGGSVVFKVKDTGIGIPTDSQPRLFNLFSRVQSVHKSEGGLGVGLALVKRLVEMHDGDVTVYSAGENQGSEFIVRLPLIGGMPAGAATNPSTSATHADTTAAAARRRILAVDDNRDALQMFQMLLELSGHDVVTATGGHEALALAGRAPPDIAFLDIGMPIMNGYELARRIREEPWGKSLKLIALSGWGQPDDARKALEAGFDMHLVKPVEEDILEELLKNHLG